MIIVMLGAPGSGKGTHGSKLCAKLGIPTISTGDMLRAAVKNGTPTGLKAKEFMDGGKLVPDDVILALIDQRAGLQKRLPSRRLPAHDTPG